MNSLKERISKKKNDSDVKMEKKIISIANEKKTTN